MEQNRIFNRAELIGRAFAIADVLAILLCALIAYEIRFHEFMQSGPYPLFLIVLAFLTINLFSWLSVYQAWRGHNIYGELVRVTIGWVLVGLTISALTFLTKTGSEFSRLWAGWTFISAYVVFIFYRVAIRLSLRRTRALGFNQKNVIILGAGTHGKRACDALINNKWAGLTPVAFFDDNPQLSGHTYNGIKVVGHLDEVASYIESRRHDGNGQNSAISQVWIALPLTAAAKIEDIRTALLDTAASVYFMPDLFSFNLTSYAVDEVVGLPVMNMSAKTMGGTNAMVKRIEDIVISLSLLIILSPFFLILAVMIKRESEGPVFFKQRRYGQDGREFMVWKFRSMSVMEDGNQYKQATKDDARVTQIGAWIRKLSIDELPQLINVLFGSMSLVGPRPHPVALNEQFRKRISGYMARHQIKPGITGWAQVNGCRGETPHLQDMEQRIRYDLEYIRNWSIFLDARILFMTLRTVINTKNTY